MPTSISNPVFLVATLIANPDHSNLTSSLIDKACHGVKATGFDVLGQNSAVDIFLPADILPLEAHEELKNALEGQKIDIIVQPVLGRRKKLLLADMDSTLIEQECIDELAEEMGLRAPIAALTEQAMRGEIAFDGALRARVALLKDLPLSAIDRVIANRITYRAGGHTLMATMRRDGAYTALVSGGFTLFTEKIATNLGMDEHHANRLKTNGVTLTGEVEEPILDAGAKVERLMALCHKLQISTQETMAVGDGANDLPMLQRAGSGIALHAKPHVAATAKMRVDYGDLTSLLYIQGYHDHEFATY